MGAADITQAFMSLVVLAVWGAIFIFVLALAILDRRWFKEHYRTGLAVAVCLFVLLTPALVFSLAYFDREAFVDRMAQPGMPREQALVLLSIGLALGAVLHVLRIGWYMIIYYVAASEWGRLEPDAFPLLRRTGRARAAPLVGALALGVAGGLASAVVLKALNVDISEPLKNITVMFPGAQSASLAVRVPVVLVTVVTIAVTEELLFRGVMFGFLLRVCGRGRLSMVFSSIVVSFIWAILHMQNTDAPLVKCTQVFIIGLVLCWLARKGNIESAMAAHVGLNLAAAVAALAM